jgi:hypothetical protein
MYVIGHYDVATNSNIVLLGFGAEHTKRFVHFGPSQKALALVCVEGDEVKRSNSFEQAIESWWPPRPLLLKIGRHNWRFTNSARAINAIPVWECSHGALSPCWGPREQRLDRARRLQQKLSSVSLQISADNSRQDCAYALRKARRYGDSRFQNRQSQFAYRFNASHFTTSTTQ